MASITYGRLDNRRYKYRGPKTRFMSIDEGNSGVQSARVNEIQRALSSSLFSEIKPLCIELSQLTMQQGPELMREITKLTSLLEELNRVLERHYRSRLGQGPYYLSANIADYIFFPLSNLLKLPALNEKVVANLLKIISFLLQHAWSQNVDVRLIDQLYPLILYLVDDSIGTKGVSNVDSKDFLFKTAAECCLASLITCLPPDHFVDNMKNLSMLGTTTTLLLDMLKSLAGPSTQEENELVISCMSTIRGLYSKLSPEQLSHILPGTVSCLTNFSTTSKTLHYSIICGILELLREIIVKVFNDKDLNVVLDGSELQAKDLEKLNELWLNSDNETTSSTKVEPLGVKIKIPSSEKKHRTTSWLRATSTQLKISLTVLFKNFFSSQNKLKLITKSQISDNLVLFVTEILEHSFLSSFKDFCPIAIDMLSMLISIMTSGKNNTIEEELKVKEFTRMIISSTSTDASANDKLELLYKQIQVKLTDLINNKLSSIIFSTDDEKINSYIVSLKFHFSMLNELSNNTFVEGGVMSTLKLKLLQLLHQHLINSFAFNNQRNKVNKGNLMLSLGGNEENSYNESENKLDNIELPPHINAHKLTNIHGQRNANTINNRNSYTENLLILSNEWSNDKSNGHLTKSSPNYFQEIYSPFIEERFIALFKYLARFDTTHNNEQILSAIELLFADTDGSNEDSTYFLNKSIALWMANNLLGANNSRKHEELPNPGSSSFDINDFLIVDGEESFRELSLVSHEPLNNGLEEISYLIMGKSQEIIEEISSLMNAPEKLTLSSKHKTQLFKVYELSYSVAIDSIGELAKYLPLKDFQTDFLMDYLYPLLEALTLQSNPLIQSHATSALDMIVQNYYNGSLELLILDNSDYLIDCLGLKLSVVSTLTPSLPGILLIIFKIAGIKLLVSNQLSDILTKIFVLIDSYHGYSALVEGFFIVFEELIKQIKDEYLKEINKENLNINSSINQSLYKPWGLSNRQQLLGLIDDSNKIIDPLSENFESSKEYFHRKPDTPFGDQLGDSDDEDDAGELNDPEESTEMPWNSSIPKNIYFVVQKIFNYGFRLLSHPSTNLKIQILKTLRNVYPILIDDYALVLPLMSQNWPVLLTLVSGSSTLSTFSENQSFDLTSDNLIMASIQFMIEIIEADKIKNERFFSRKFIDLWEHLTVNSKISRFIKGTHETNPTNEKYQNDQIIKLETSMSPTALNPKMIQLYVKLIITGMNTYERIVPDVTAYSMIKFCYKIGIPEKEYLVKEVQNILWVIKYENN